MVKEMTYSYTSTPIYTTQNTEYQNQTMLVYTCKLRILFWLRTSKITCLHL